jgi:class 3 adenylate cyclase/ActR/RegA family two-component response regulator
MVVVLAKLRHEFRGQLNAIIGCSELLLEDCSTQANQRLIDDLKKVQLGGQHMLKLVNKLLDPDELESRGSDQALKEGAAQASQALRSTLENVIALNESLTEEVANLELSDLTGDLQNIRVAAGRLLALLDRLASFNAEPQAGGVKGQNSPPKTFALPALKIGMTEALKPMSKEEIETAAAECGHLLVVDSNQLDRDLLARRLSRFGHMVETAESGRQALAMMRAERFDLVLLDILMPEMNGFQVLQEIQADESLRDVPVIVASSLHEIEGVARAIALGATDYLPKPFNTVLLRMRISACLEKKRLRDQEIFYLRELERLNEDLEVRNQFIRQAFGRYTSDELVARLLETPEGLSLGGESRQVTILMSDLRGFTSLSERLSPDQIVALLNIYLGEMAEVIMEYQGMIDEFIGDAILVIFGAPIQRAGDARRAVACAVAMQLAMEEVNAMNRRMGLPEIHMGIGLNTGEVVAGNIGSLKRTKYGVIGSEVNLTSRVESFTVGGQILITDSTRKAVGDSLRIDGQMVVEPKGVKAPITIYDVGGIGGEYDLFLPEKAAEYLPLMEEIPLRYWVVEGKRTQLSSREGRLVKLASDGAELRLDSAVAPFSNLKLQLIGVSGESAGLDFYVKALRGTDDRGAIPVSFTSVPPEVAFLFQNLMARR